MEFCVTVNPDPKKKVGKTQYAAMAAKKQYSHLAYVLSYTSARMIGIKSWKYYFEIGSQGTIHAHGSIFIDLKDDNSHMMVINEYQRYICNHFARNTNSKYYMNICCTIKQRDDTIVSEKYPTWDEYLLKHQKNRPDFMKPVESTMTDLITQMRTHLINETQPRELNLTFD